MKEGFLFLNSGRTWVFWNKPQKILFPKIFRKFPLRFFFNIFFQKSIEFAWFGADSIDFFASWSIIHNTVANVSWIIPGLSQPSLWRSSLASVYFCYFYRPRYYPLEQYSIISEENSLGAHQRVLKRQEMQQKMQTLKKKWGGMRCLSSAAQRSKRIEIRGAELRRDYRN